MEFLKRSCCSTLENHKCICIILFILGLGKLTHYCFIAQYYLLLTCFYFGKVLLASAEPLMETQAEKNKTNMEKMVGVSKLFNVFYLKVFPDGRSERNKVLFIH